MAMNRRTFVKSVSSGAALLAVGPRMSRAAADPSWRSFKITYEVELPADGVPARLWLPLPASELDDYQTGLAREYNAQANQAGFYEGPMAVRAFFAEWDGDRPRTGTVTSYVKTRDRSVDLQEAARAKPAPLPEEVRVFLQPTRHIATDGIVRDTALKATRGAATPLEKAQGIYEWIVENTFREPTTRGCGVGDIKFMLETGSLGGKCADINSLFVGMARSVGIPARELFGIRVADSAIVKSLGKSGEISKAQHCRAEFYLAGFGWIPVDPADVRKVVLEEKLPLADPKVAEIRKRLFGNWEMNWVAYNYARDFQLTPRADFGPVNFFMYPIAAVASQQRDSLDPPKFTYRILAEEITA